MSTSGHLQHAAVAALLTGVCAAAAPSLATAAPAARHAGKHHAKKHHAKKHHKKKHHKKKHRGSSATTPPATTAPAAPTIHVSSDAIAAPGFHVVLDATRAVASAPTTTGTFGPFRGDAVPGALLGVDTVAGYFAGPVQCLQATGHDASLFYPIESADPPALAGAGGVFIYLHDGGPGQADQISFTPVPQTTVTDCPVMPGSALMPVTSGDVVVQAGA